MTRPDTLDRDQRIFVLLGVIFLALLLGSTLPDWLELLP